MVRHFLWWLLPDSNWGHRALQAPALPTELKSRLGSILSDISVILLDNRAFAKVTCA